MDNTLLRNAIRLALLPTSVFAALGAGVAMAQAPAEDAEAESTTKMEVMTVTGSRIKRADIEGALPVTVIERSEIEASGDISVSDFLRNTTFNSFGSFRPRSGSSAQAFSELSLRGLGGNRTLVLIDGRRAPVSPSTGTGQDLNAIPLAAVERFEILSDGASAIYGSDAIGGVVNIITRKDFNGVEVSLGASNPKLEGGETEEGQMLFGASSDRGSLIAGASYNNRGIVYQRDRPYSSGGASTFSNNYLNPNGSFFSAPSGPTAGTSAVPGGCSLPGFTVVGNRCLYDFTSLAADEAELHQSALFTRATYEINDDWSTYMNASVSRVTSFGRYAPGLATVAVAANTPNNPFNVDLTVRHRFAALGTRDDSVESNAYDLSFGFVGRIGTIDVEAGVRRNEFQTYTIGRNYPVIPLANAAIADGSYSILHGAPNDQSVLDSIKATISRDSFTLNEELFGLASMDLFEMTGGNAAISVGAEYRKEDYADVYDSLSAAGVIGGSAGASAAGGRDVKAAYFEMLLPVLDNFEVSLAGRYDRYSDYGSDFSPKIGLRFQPTESLTLRASYGHGFAAPAIPLLVAAPRSGADFVTDTRTCLAFGLTADCRDPVSGNVSIPQVTAWTIANPNLSSETSKQFSLGLAWDASDWLNLTVDYWNIKIEDLIAPITTNTIIACLDGQDVACPPGLSNLPQTGSTGRPVEEVVPNPQLGLGLARDPVTGLILYVQNGSANQGTLETDGIDLNVRTNFDFADWGSLRNQLQVGRVLSVTNDGGRNFVGDERTPAYRANLQNIYTLGDFEFTWNVNYIHGTDSANALRDEPLPGVELTLPSWTTHDLQLAWNAPWDGKIALGVQNVANRGPVLDSLDPTGRGFDFGLYDGYGRVPYLRYTQTF
jgi:iron complex outermembrane receptor protein